MLEPVGTKRALPTGVARSHKKKWKYRNCIRAAEDPEARPPLHIFGNDEKSSVGPAEGRFTRDRRRGVAPSQAGLTRRVRKWDLRSSQ